MEKRILKCIAVDDERSGLKALLERINERSDLHLVWWGTDPTVVVQKVAEYGADLLFVDMQMDKLHGLDLIKQLDGQLDIICCSAYDNYGPRLYAYSSIRYYLEKPYHQEQFDRAVNRVFEMLDLKTRASDGDAGQYVPKLTDEFYLILPGKENRMKLCFEEMDMFIPKSDSEQVVLYAGNKRIVLNMTMSQLNRALPPAFFIQVHRDCILSKRNILSLKSGVLLELRGIVGRTEQQVGRTYISKVKSMFKNER
ncbi:MAG: LytTR family transcriptional regulator DNA-binding domain-containing protein [Sphingobacterium sp.]|jgi:DNA-binding LytR/AlgR family response regulator|nr:LytTR family transcriptional regulator DNA-binding domain-containing protein [Sphingobacterium sp.]